MRVYTQSLAELPLNCHHGLINFCTVRSNPIQHTCA